MRTKCYQRVFLAKEGLGCVAIFLVVFDDIVIVVVVDDNVGGHKVPEKFALPKALGVQPCCYCCCCCCF